MTSADQSPAILVMGIGNYLMGDEGIGVHVIHHIQERSLPSQVEVLDGGTGGFTLLGPMSEAGRIVLIDATADGGETGRVQRLTPRFSSEYPPTLTAHDIGLKDVLDAFYLMGKTPDVVLFAISVRPPFEFGTALSPALARAVPDIAATVLAELPQA
jgi:hydrogenase maturation protease